MKVCQRNSCKFQPTIFYFFIRTYKTLIISQLWLRKWKNRTKSDFSVRLWAILDGAEARWRGMRHESGARSEVDANRPPLLWGPLSSFAHRRAPSLHLQSISRDERTTRSHPARGEQPDGADGARRAAGRHRLVQLVVHLLQRRQQQRAPVFCCPFRYAILSYRPHILVA